MKNNKLLTKHYLTLRDQGLVEVEFISSDEQLVDELVKLLSERTKKLEQEEQRNERIVGGLEELQRYVEQYIK